MLQILQIFHKDGRRHWLEILASLVLLGAYAHHVMHPWLREPSAMYIGRFFWMNELITPALVMFWFFVILRIVQGETLVGDRQWWVTKPYVWWKLFLSKCLFVFAAISLPLFFVQLYLLFINGFPVFPNLLGVLRMQAALVLTLFLSAFLLGALTRNLAQAILTIVALFVAFFTGVRLFADGFSLSLSGPGLVPDSIQSGLSFLFTIGLLLWQFAFRRTWQSRGLLCLGVALVAILASLPGDKNYVENTYPLVKDNQAPARIELNFPAQGQKAGKEERWSEFIPEVYLHVPLKISGLAPGGQLSFEGMKLTLTASDGAVWTKGWRSIFAQVWPEDEAVELTYGMNRKDFEKWKDTTVRVQIELAMSRYVEDQPREVVLPAGVFSDPELGTCRINPDNASQVECMRPFHAPSYLATFDAREFPCGEAIDSGEDSIWHGRSGPYSPEFLGSGFLSPIEDHTINFGGPKWNRKQLLPRGFRLCPGAKIRIAYPKFSENSRVELEIPSISVASLSRGFTSLRLQNVD